MKAFHVFFSSIIVALLCALLVSCQGIEGYGVVLWNVPEQNLSDGTIVPVYIKSNVSHVYVIGLPDSKEKFEVPLWQISEPASHGKAKKLAAKYKAYEHTYARCVLDGLPIRAERVNTSKQVYRLRKDEVIRALYEAEGAAVVTGQNAMEGKWLRVITNNGTIGWCFSHNLRLFIMNSDGSVASNGDSSEVVETDKTLETMLATKWYPESYSAMIKSGNIDLSNMNITYGFDTGRDSEKVAMHLPGLDVEYPYMGTTKSDDNVYKFTDTPFQVTVRGPTFIVVQYTDDTGIPKSFNFVSLEADVEQLVTEETERRADAYTHLRVEGPDFRSSNYGTLSFEDKNNFKWSGYSLLVPSIISSSAQGSGTVTIEYLLSDDLKSSWDGVLTFRFDGMEDEVNFLYKLESNGLRLEDASNVTLKGNVVTARSSNSLVMFFAD